MFRILVILFVIITLYARNDILNAIYIFLKFTCIIDEKIEAYFLTKTKTKI